MEIRDVWAWNFEIEFSRFLQAALLKSPGSRSVAIDVEFPGFIRQAPPYASRESTYPLLRENVESLKPIQLGAAVAAADGTLLGAWCFNFHFDPFCDLYNLTSINFLVSAGLDFARHRMEGIPYEIFGQRWGRSPLVRNPNLCWVVFSGFYDWAYMLKIIRRGNALPGTLTLFDAALHDVCPSRFDLRYVEPVGSLTQLAAKYGLRHRGLAHTGGSDALLTLEVLYYTVVPRAAIASLPVLHEVLASKHAEASTDFSVADTTCVDERSGGESSSESVVTEVETIASSELPGSSSHKEAEEEVFQDDPESTKNEEGAEKEEAEQVEHTVESSPKSSSKQEGFEATRRLRGQNQVPNRFTKKNESSPPSHTPWWKSAEDELRASMREFMVEQGGSCDGPRLAARFASLYNQRVRVGVGRNDGSFRKWVDATPWLGVEHCGHNKWRVAAYESEASPPPSNRRVKDHSVSSAHCHYEDRGGKRQQGYKSAAQKNRVHVDDSGIEFASPTSVWRLKIKDS